MAQLLLLTSVYSGRKGGGGGAGLLSTGCNYVY